MRSGGRVPGGSLGTKPPKVDDILVLGHTFLRSPGACSGSSSDQTEATREGGRETGEEWEEERWEREKERDELICTRQDSHVLLSFVGATTEFMLNVSDAYDEYWVKTGQSVVFSLYWDKSCKTQLIILVNSITASGKERQNIILTIVVIYWLQITTANVSLVMVIICSGTQTVRTVG